MSLVIRQMSRGDLDIALGWGREEGWSPGLDDGDAFYAQDRSGFLMGWLEAEPIACISVVKYDPGFAFLGLYIVRPDWRGKGHGKAIWDAGIASAGGQTIGLDGVVAQQDNYRKSGFELAHRSARWGGVLSASHDATDHLIEEVTPQSLGAVLAFDRECFPGARPDFLTAWLAPSTTRRSLWVREGDAVLGYGTIRQSVTGYKIGPLFARTPQAASGLFAALARHAQGAPIFIDVPPPTRPPSGWRRGLALARALRPPGCIVARLQPSWRSGSSGSRPSSSADGSSCAEQSMITLEVRRGTDGART